MSFLNSTTMAQLQDRLAVEGAAASEEQVETRAVETEVSKQDAKPVTQDSSSEVETDAEGHAVPYKRFKSVIEGRNELKSKNSELNRQLDELRAQMEVRNGQPKHKEEDELDSIFRQLDAREDAPDERYSSLEGRLKSFEQRQAQSELEKELNQVTRQYPNVPEAVLLQAVVNDPNTSMVAVARQYDAWVSEIQQDAIAGHLKTAKQGAPRRPTSSGGNGPTPSNTPRTMKDAREAALSFWKTQMG